MAMLATQAINMPGWRSRAVSAGRSTRRGAIDASTGVTLLLIKRAAPNAAPATAMTAPERYAAGYPATEPTQLPIRGPTAKPEPIAAVYTPIEIGRARL